MSASGVSIDPEKVEARMSWERPMQVGILGVEDETYFSSYLDSPEQGTRVHSVL